MDFKEWEKQQEAERKERVKCIKRIRVLSARNEKSRQGLRQDLWMEAKSLGAERCDVCGNWEFYTLITEVETGKITKCKDGDYHHTFSFCDDCYWRIRDGKESE